jgi:hypothetical protein
MRLSFALVLLLPSVAAAQTEEMIKAVERKLETLKYVRSLEAPDGGFYAAAPDPKADAKPQPSLRATNGAVRAWKYLGGEGLGSKLPNKDRHAAFVLKCYDPTTGGFAEPGGKPDVTITSVGVMAAAELDIPHEKYAKAMDYLKENAKTFEEVRIGAAAVEAWGVKDCPFDLKVWEKMLVKTAELEKATAAGYKDGGARAVGSVIAFYVRLDLHKAAEFDWFVNRQLALGQRDDGGWGKKGEKASDIETTYRVMRTLWWLKDNPKDVNKPPVATDLKAVRKFVDAHRNEDGGYATKPGDKSSMSGVYYSVTVSKWLDEMEAKK